MEMINNVLHYPLRNRILQAMLHLVPARTIMDDEQVILHLEELLFTRSKNLREYGNIRTLHKRFRFLIYTLYRNVLRPHAMEAGITTTSSSKSTNMVTEMKTYVQHVPGVDSPNKQPLFLNNQLELISAIYSFLPMKTLMAHRLINHSAAVLLPHALQTLSWDTTMMEKSLLMNLGAAYPNIRSLQIHQPRSHTENPKKSKRDLGMKPTLERELHALAHDVVVQHHFRHLQHLRINSAFSNTQPGKGIDAVVSILKACPNLISLQLDENCLGDAGVERLLTAPLFRLQELSLCENYITDHGCGLLCEAFKKRPRALKVLKLEDNILTDDSLESISTLRSNYPVTTPMRLWLGKNYFTPRKLQKMKIEFET